MAVAVVVAEWLLERAGQALASKLTGIKPSRILEHAIGRVTPQLNTLAKYQKAWNDVSFSVLRDAGFNYSTARKYTGTSPFGLDNIITRYENTINAIAKREGYAYDDILDTFRKSRRVTNLDEAPY